VEIVYLGNNVASEYMAQTLAYLENKSFCVNVISKSGTTTETSVAFRLLRLLLEKQLGEEGAHKAIFATTDASKGLLKQMADKFNWTSFVLPSNIGGRYSVFTSVGLLPMASQGFAIKDFIKGATKAMKALDGKDDNEALQALYKYVAFKHTMCSMGKPVELFVTFDPAYAALGEWLKQLFMESEGKGHQGIFLSSATFTTDLHSLGQFIQDGTPLLFETFIRVNTPRYDLAITQVEDDCDELNYLKGKKISFVEKAAYKGTVAAHKAGGVHGIDISIPTMNEANLGELLYFFMRACALSSYLFKVNPFDQPGVELYKKNMFKLLGKPGSK
jgi:glucose-6-phosphate isomerase